MSKEPLPPIARAYNLVRDLHIIRASQSAMHQVERYQRERSAPDLVLLAPTVEERELILQALLEQLHITEDDIKAIITGSPLPNDVKNKILAAIDAGEWPSEPEREEPKKKRERQ